MDYKYAWVNGIFVDSVFWSGRNFPLYVIEKETGVKQSFGHVRKDEVKGRMMIMNFGSLRVVQLLIFVVMYLVNFILQNY